MLIQQSNVLDALSMDYIPRYGVPQNCIMDRAFKDNEVTPYLRHLGVNVRYCTPHHPRSVGLTERHWGFFRKTLRCAVSEGKDWEEEIFHSLFAYRNTICRSTRLSPFFLTHAYRPRTNADFLLRQPRTFSRSLFANCVNGLCDAMKEAVRNSEISQQFNVDLQAPLARLEGLKEGDYCLYEKQQLAKFQNPYDHKYFVLKIYKKSNTALVLSPSNKRLVYNLLHLRRVDPDCDFGDLQRGQPMSALRKQKAAEKLALALREAKRAEHLGQHLNQHAVDQVPVTGPTVDTITDDPMNDFSTSGSDMILFDAVRRGTPDIRSPVVTRAKTGAVPFKDLQEPPSIEGDSNFICKTGESVMVTDDSQGSSNDANMLSMPAAPPFIPAPPDSDPSDLIDASMHTIIKGPPDTSDTHESLIVGRLNFGGARPKIPATLENDSPQSMSIFDGTRMTPRILGNLEKEKLFLDRIKKPVGRLTGTSTPIFNNGIIPDSLFGQKSVPHLNLSGESSKNDGLTLSSFDDSFSHGTESGGDPSPSPSSPDFNTFDVKRKIIFTHENPTNITSPRIITEPPAARRIPNVASSLSNNNVDKNASKTPEKCETSDNPELI